MLDSFIIEELRRREKQERERATADRPVLRLPVDDRDDSPRPSSRDNDAEPGVKRGVVVIDI